MKLTLIERALICRAMTSMGLVPSAWPHDEVPEWAVRRLGRKLYKLEQLLLQNPIPETEESAA